MSDCAGLSRDHVRFLASLSHAKRCWAAALRVSVLSYCPHVFRDDDELELLRLPRQILAWLRGTKVEPTLVFKEILSEPVGGINNLIDRTETFLEQKFRDVHTGICLFVDKVDQAMRDLPRQAWIHVQAGLIEAAWDAMNANSHVKMFVSIRQEAFSNYESDIKTNLFGAIAIIQYTQKDLAQLLDQLTRCYEGQPSFQEFVHINTVRHSSTGYCEDAFRYVERHSLGRPRDLVIIASELSRRQDEMGEVVFRRVVDDVSSRVIVANVFDETRVFLDTLRDPKNRSKPFGLIPHNILSRQEVFEVSARYNGIDLKTLEMYGRDADEIHHPFWELYSTGLLGVLERPLDERNGLVQRFKQSHDMIQPTAADLPESDFYLIHPALDFLIRRQHPRNDYDISTYVLIGHNYPWRDQFAQLLRLEWALYRVGEEEIRRDVRVLIEQLFGWRHPNMAQPDLPSVRASDNWNDIMQRLEQVGYDELWLGLEELVHNAHN